MVELPRVSKGLPTKARPAGGGGWLQRRDRAQLTLSWGQGRARDRAQLTLSYLAGRKHLDLFLL